VAVEKAPVVHRLSCPSGDVVSALRPAAFPTRTAALPVASGSTDPAAVLLPAGDVVEYLPATHPLAGGAVEDVPSGGVDRVQDPESGREPFDRSHWGTVDDRRVRLSLTVEPDRLAHVALLVDDGGVAPRSVVGDEVPFALAVALDVGLDQPTGVDVALHLDRVVRQRLRRLRDPAAHVVGVDAAGTTAYVGERIEVAQVHFLLQQLSAGVDVAMVPVGFVVRTAGNDFAPHAA